ncbi:unnamed protein product [Staurois parvus]|uniref:Uncharacterized protein n=1 Tax=Staurois parvus TaxID=386267 RepID=A0ABN9H3Y6_9NEOB|nr:unnamed protein product [Staurois parvus]
MMLQESNIQSGETNTQPQSELHPEQDLNPELYNRKKCFKKPSWKIQENFNADKLELQSNINDLWSNTVECMFALSQQSPEPIQLEGTIQQLNVAYENYQRLCV